jgi:hypothetical protein
MRIAPLALALLALPQEEDRAVTVTQVVEWMTKESKRTFVLDEQVATAFGPKKISAGPGALDASRAYESGCALLRAAGLAVVPLEEPSTARIVPASAAFREALRVYASAAELPKADEFCTLIAPLRHLGVREAQAALMNLTYPQGVVPVESASSLVLSDFASNLRKLAEVLRQIDVQRVWSAFRVSVAVLEGAKDREDAVPAEFRKLDLPALTGRNRFAALGEAMARVDIPAGRADGLLRPGLPPVPAAADAAMRFGGARPLLVEFAASVRGEGGPTLDRFTVRDDKEGTQAGPRLLETRVELKDGEWTLVGTVPGEKEGSVLVVLVRARRN